MSIYYAEHKATVSIADCEMLEGDLPKRQKKPVLAWAELHQEELMADWELVMNGEPPFRIQPLNDGVGGMSPAVVSVAPKGDYELEFVFETGEQGVLDMKPYLGFGVFQALKDRQRFNTVRVAFDTIEWPGEIDLDPAFVYAKCKIERLAETASASGGH